MSLKINWSDVEVGQRNRRDWWKSSASGRVRLLLGSQMYPRRIIDAFQIADGYTIECVAVFPAHGMLGEDILSSLAEELLRSDEWIVIAARYDPELLDLPAEVVTSEILVLYKPGGEDPYELVALRAKKQSEKPDG